MRCLPLDPTANRSPEALAGFLGSCRVEAESSGKPVLASISMEVPALDPLAVLESIFEPGEAHFYVEKASAGLALAGAEAVLSHACAGAGRFAECRAFVEDTLSRTIAVGAHGRPFGGPLFFLAFSFQDQTEPGEPFPAATVFVPRWQVGVCEGATIATANLLIRPGEDPTPQLLRVWRAQSKFNSFDYGATSAQGTTSDQSSTAASTTPPVPAAAPGLSSTEVGGEGAYAAAVRRALGLIGEGRFEKIVLARARDFHSDTTLHPLQALNALRQRFPDCFAFSLANGRGQSFIGASPERLARVSDGTLQTEALAGSARRGSTASEDASLGGALLRDEKELREHQFVIASIARRLAGLGITLEPAARPALRRLANVQHIHSPLHARLPEGVRLLDVLERLHPTPAVGGSPREAAVPCIRDLETFPRGLYAGALGWLDARGEGEFFVGLRSALIDGPCARLYAGAGIVAGSAPEREYAETELKIRAMREAIL